MPAADTNGVYSFVEIVSEPGDGTPLHVHQNEDEYLFVLEGTGALRSATGYSMRKPERWSRFPKTFLTPGATARPQNCGWRSFVYPGGAEDAMRIIAKGEVVDIPALAAKFGVTVLGPTPF